jgi:hypothetical protein
MTDTERADSPDLTDAEIESAIPSAAPSDLVPNLSQRDCPECHKLMAPTKQELKRRKPSLYMRVMLECETEGHPLVQRVFRLDWMQDST